MNNENNQNNRNLNNRNNLNRGNGLNNRNISNQSQGNRSDLNNQNNRIYLNRESGLNNRNISNQSQGNRSDLNNQNNRIYLNRESGLNNQNPNIRNYSINQNANNYSNNLSNQNANNYSNNLSNQNGVNNQKNSQQYGYGRIHTNPNQMQNEYNGLRQLDEMYRRGMKAQRGSKRKKVLVATTLVAAAVTAVVVPVVIFQKKEGNRYEVIVESDVKDFQSYSITLTRGATVSDLKEQLNQLEGHILIGVYKDQQCTLIYEDTDKINKDTTVYLKFEKERYSINIPTSDLYTVGYSTGIDPENIEWGETFIFWLDLDESCDPDSVRVYVGNSTIPLDADNNGRYRINFVDSDTSIRVEAGISIYDITIPEGVIVTDLEGNHIANNSQLEHGTQIKVTYTEDEGYRKSEFKINGEDQFNGVTINVSSDIIITYSQEQLGYIISLPDEMVGYEIEQTSDYDDLEQLQYGNVYTFKANVHQGYNSSIPVVMVNSVVLSPDIYGVYTVSINDQQPYWDISRIFNIRVTGVNINTYSVSAVSGTGYSIQNLPTIAEYGQGFTFDITLNEGYTMSNPSVVVNGATLDATISRDGNTIRYTVKDVVDNVTISITDVNINTYTITATADSEVYTIDNLPSTIKHNETVEFTLTLKDGYTKGTPSFSDCGADITVRAYDGATYTYTYEISNPTRAIDLVINVAKNQYEVIFKNYDGTQLYKANIEHGNLATYTGETPTRPSTNAYHYTFTGWDKELTTQITSDTVFTAQFDEERIEYSLTYIIGTGCDAVVVKDSLGNILDTNSTLYYGDEITITCIVADSHQYVELINIIGLEKDGEIYRVVGNVSFTARGVGENQYVVTLPTGTGYTASFTVAGEDGVVNYGDEISFKIELDVGYDGSKPTVKANGNTLSGSNGIYTISGVTEDIAVTVEGVVINAYTVIFKNADGTELQSGKVNHGAYPEYTGETPTKDSDNALAYTWKFIGWGGDLSLEPITMDTTFTAHYEQEWIEYELTYTQQADSTIYVTNQGGSGATAASGMAYYGDEIKIYIVYNSLTHSINDFSVEGATYKSEQTAGGEEDFAQIYTYTVTGNVTISYVVEAINKFNFTLIDNGTAYSVSAIDTSISGDVTIPAEYNGKPVTTIAANGFKDCTSITSVTLPESITTIENNAFMNCSELADINIPEYVTIIGESAFCYCNALTSVNIPASVQTIGDYSFYAGDLEELIFEENSQLTSIGHGAFLACNFDGTIIIPSAVNYIGANAFFVAFATSAVIGFEDPNGWSVKHMQTGETIGIASEDLTNSDTIKQLFEQYHASQVIDSYYWTKTENAVSLTLNVDGTAKSVWAESGAKLEEAMNACGYTNENTCGFYSDADLTTPYDDDDIVFEGMTIYTKTVDEAMLAKLSFVEVGTTAYSVKANNTSIEGEVVIPKEYNGLPVTTIAANGFKLCQGLSSVTIPARVTIINESAFMHCYDLTSITIPTNVITIGDNAFYSCSDLISITIPSSVTSIGKSAFNGAGLTSVIIPASVTYIGVGAFTVNRTLTSIVVDSDNTYYTSRDSEGNQCNVIVEIATSTLVSGCNNSVIPSGVTSIGDSAFSYSGVTSVVIPQGVTTIGDNAFYRCSDLTQITMPDTITIIGDRAFCLCGNLTSVTIPSGVTRIGISAFNGAGLTRVTIPASVASIGVAAFAVNGTLTSVVVHSDNTHYTSRDSEGNQCNVIVEVATSTLVSGCNNSVIPNGVTSIADSAFMSSDVSSVILPQGVTTIGENAFYSCSDLTQITMPDTITIIGDGAFAGCNLTSITIPSSVIMIAACAFSGCYNLTSVTFNNTEGWTLSGRVTSIDVSSTDLANTATAANYLTDTYEDYTWTRTE